MNKVLKWTIIHLDKDLKAHKCLSYLTKRLFLNIIFMLQMQKHSTINSLLALKEDSLNEKDFYHNACAYNDF